MVSSTSGYTNTLANDVGYRNFKRHFSPIGNLSPSL
jgi:hypothetical protein